jgi:3-methylcrotonyl-CoA carboxylase alpha subunit
VIQSLLIANRGEIACRVIRTARALGIRTVAVYSDADAKALHVRQADEAVHIGPSPAAESYLRGDKIIAAALETGAEAIHPGYGFLSENAEFAEAVAAAGLIWVGPKPESIRAMGLKDAAKTLMQDAGVPVTPGYLGEDQSPERLLAEAEKIGWPVLIKAVAGGGGKGMRKVDAADDFLAALESCRREASASFGNDQVLLEKWITSPRHIEVQVFGDTHGNVVHLFERDCSLQRRHQKVIEEAPAPGMDAATREAICAAAVRAAKAVDYVGAGTIEFIADASEGLSAERIFFMEMNTRLQVEHPVTEEITGVDLVEWQLRVASGEPLPLKQQELKIDGWAMEARLYAEDPASGFLPSPGRVDHLGLDPRVRVETGVEEGDTVSSFYDPMIAKLVVHADEREAARRAMLAALDASYVAPLRTNQGFLFECLARPEFALGKVDTGLIGRLGDELIPKPEPSSTVVDAAARRYRLDFLDWSGELGGPVGALREGLFGFRLNAPSRETITLSTNSGSVQGSSANYTLASGICTTMTPQGELLVTDRGQTHLFKDRAAQIARAGLTDGAILAPMPGKVIAVDVAAGEAVTKGQRLLVIEAMKMEHALTAPFDGTVAELAVSEGQQVQVEALLARVEGSSPQRGGGPP